MPKPQKKGTAKPSRKANAPNQPASKRIFLLRAVRVVLTVVMLAIPVYLYTTRARATIELTFSSTHLGLQLGYSDAENVLSREVRILEKSLDAKYLHSSFFSPFYFTAIPANKVRNSEYQIEPLVRDKATLLMTTKHGYFSVVSLTYKGATQMELAASEASMMLDFRPALRNSDSWNVYVDVSLPDTFRIMPEACAMRLVDSDTTHSSNDDLLPADFESFNASPNVVLANFDDHLKLQIDNATLSNQVIFTNLNTNSFRTTRFDPIQRRNLPALLDGHFQVISSDDRVRHEIAANSAIEFVADSLRLDELKLINGVISSRFVGIFSSLKICQLGSCNEVIPSRLTILLESAFFRAVSIFYISVLVGLVAGIDGIKFLLKKLID